VPASPSNGGALSVEVARGGPPRRLSAWKWLVKRAFSHSTVVRRGSFQSGRLRLSLDGEPQNVDQGESGPMPDTAANVAGIYAVLRDDIAQGTATAPDFKHAVRLARLMDDVLSSAQTGTRKSAADWPVR
jgi:hypothetical protein